MSTKVGTNGVPGLCYAEMERGTDGSKQIRMIRACRNEKEKKNDNERRRMERAARNEVEHNNNNNCESDVGPPPGRRSLSLARMQITICALSEKR